MAEDTTYNGWKNYPTWCVNLWLSNEEPLYREALERTSNALAGSFTFDDDPHAGRSSVADALKTWVSDDLAPDLGATFAADLMGYALDLVDWYEVADAWIEMASDE